eukprot:Blabericola_migrator_1__1177@NODE_12_length_24658_cov_176_683258_g9_i0_p2_GENE_NODE_12_length_24658_cov_176_683258_g9_i0NODE_12_length_24658_cov_176_683258_g9_i0_p2_ORF_typecomplete_len682_score107_35SRP_TPR_like/PF17004_5/3_4e03SRP_TPR_like/PF17004_5/0_018Coatomer_E/PF04733_14/0_0086ANAPC3/PF12895_7/8_2e03ANAPC3/PF12895_7/1_7ANAPC3/PF12895_7/4_1_NODE_12_length_24658_cov_176_683258_g9_i01278114826
MSDDEPPRDQEGDLVPLSIKGTSRILAFKRIDKIGDVFKPATLSDEIEATISIRGEMSEQHTCTLRTLAEKGFLESLVAAGIQLMKVDETATIYTLTACLNQQDPVEKLNPKQLRHLQRLRRKFAQANGSRTQWSLLKSSDYTPIAHVTLSRVISRQDFGGMTKAVVVKSYSWQIPKQDARLSLRVSPVLDSSMSLQQLIKDTQDGNLVWNNCTVVLNEVASPSCRFVLQSFKVGEVAVLEWTDNSISRCLCDLTGLKTLQESHRMVLTLDAMADCVEYDVFDEMESPHVILEKFAGASIETDAKPIGQLTLSSVFGQTADEYLKKSKIRGSEAPQPGSLVIVTLRLESCAFNLLLVVGRSDDVPVWFHSLLGLARKGVTYDAHLRLHEVYPLTPHPISRADVVLSDCLFNPSEERFPCGCITSPEAQVENKSSRAEVFEALGYDTIKWNQYKHLLESNDIRFQFCIMKEIGQEIGAWDGVPGNVWSHVTFMANRSFICVKNGQYGMALVLANAVGRLHEQLLHRALDDQPSEGPCPDLSFIQDCGFELTNRHQRDHIPTITNWAPEFAAVSLASAKYVEAWILSRKGKRKAALNILKKITTSCSYVFKALSDPRTTSVRVKVLNLKASMEFQLGDYAECRDTCEAFQSESAILSGLLKWSRFKLKQHNEARKKMYTKMFG